MLIILGKTASGKTTVLNHLCKKGFKQLVTYTSRPQRKGESAQTYHFISEEEFLQKIDDGFFAEWCSYNTIHGKWYYGSAKEDYVKADSKTVVILNPVGFRSVSRIGDIPIKSVYLYANISTMRKRLKKRGDNAKEIERRIEADQRDFKGIEMEVDRIVYNNTEDKIKDVTQKIIDLEGRI